MFSLRNRNGQALIEFALVLVIFVTLLLGVLEFGKLFFFLSSLNAASRQGARYGIAASHLNDCHSIRDATLSNLTNLIYTDNIEITYLVSGASYSCPAPGGEIIAAGDKLTVSVTSTYEATHPIFGFLNGSYSSSATRSILVNLSLP